MFLPSGMYSFQTVLKTVIAVVGRSGDLHMLLILTFFFFFGNQFKPRGARARAAQSYGAFAKTGICGHWTLDTGHWTLDTGHWTLDISPAHSGGCCGGSCPAHRWRRLAAAFLRRPAVVRVSSSSGCNSRSRSRSGSRSWSRSRSRSRGRVE